MPGDDPGTPGEDESGGVDSVADVAATDQATGQAAFDSAGGAEGAEGDYYDPFAITTEGSDPTIQDFMAAGLNPQALGVAPDPGGPLGGGNLGDPDPVSGGIGGLIDKVTPDGPDLMTILTAPLETLISFFTFGLVDPEFTGKDVFGIPGASSSDFSRAMEGKVGPQAPGVELGFPMLGGIEVTGEGARGTGIFENFGLNKDFLSEANKTHTLNRADAGKLDMNTANQLASEKMEAARDLATNYQQMDTTYTPEKVDIGFQEALRSRGQAGTSGAMPAAAQHHSGGTSPLSFGYAPPQSAPAPPAEVSFAGRSRGPGGVMPGSAYDVSGLGSAGGWSPGTVDPGLQAALDANAKELASEKAMVESLEKANRDAGLYSRSPISSQDVENAYLAGGDPYYGYSGPPLGGAFSAGSTAGKVASGYQKAMQNQSPDVSVMLANAIRNSLSSSPAKASERLSPSSSSFGVTSPHATVQASALNPQIQAAKKALGSDFDLLREFWSNLQKIGGKAGGGAVRGPVTGGQRSRGIMSLR